MIAIIDYDMGNLKSVHKAFESVGHRAAVTRDPKLIADASHVVLPGVGAFGDCMRNLGRYGLVEPVLGAIQAGKPFLGICLGFQLLFSESEEFGTHRGLGVIPGRVVRFASGGSATPMKVPHMGWNSIASVSRSRSSSTPCAAPSSASRSPRTQTGQPAQESRRAPDACRTPRFR